jgi:hypothetical protein
MLATDTGDAWLVEAQQGRLEPRRDADGSEEAGCTGDPGLLYAWQSSVRVRWE